jgi:DNA-binding CsgD family transcriptional regulator
VLHQDINGNITHLLGVCNDITQWKKNGSQLASLTSTVDQKYYLFHSDNTSAIKPKSILSKRELEIVKLMAEGCSSKHIADKLFISFHTVNTHRQKMIEKTNTKNTGGLIQFASFNGLI